AAGSEVLLADQGQVGFVRSQRRGGERRRHEAAGISARASAGGAPHRRQDGRGGARARGGAQGARNDPSQGRAGRRRPARQARRLSGKGSRAVGDLHRRGRLRRRRGQIYIAQPPLYKIKRGKQESYVKDDNELNQVLLNAALESAGLHVNGEAPPLSGSALEVLARKYMEVQAIIKRWSRRYDDRLLEQLIYMPEVTLGSFDRAEWLRGWAHDLNQRLNALADGTRTYRVEVRAAGDSQAARVIV